MTTEISDRLDALTGLSHSDLKVRWQELFGETPPRNLSKRLMIYALAYRIQVQAYGGLSNATRQDLRDRAGRTVSKQWISTQSGVGASDDVNRPSSSRLPGQRLPLPALKLSPGTRLMREWRGTVHVVDVTAEGFVWNGRSFRSLSAIARTITGVRWNGLAFFGLRKRRNKSKAGRDEQSSDVPTAQSGEDAPSHESPAGSTGPNILPASRSTEPPSIRLLHSPSDKARQRTTT